MITHWRRESRGDFEARDGEPPACYIRGMTRLRIVLLALAIALLAHCSAQDTGNSPFLDSLQCGMTRAEVSRLAHDKGYSDSDASWLTRSTQEPAKRSKNLELLDLTFEQGRLVGYREGTYDPKTKVTTYRTVDLCGRE